MVFEQHSERTVSDIMVTSIFVLSLCLLFYGITENPRNVEGTWVLKQKLHFEMDFREWKTNVERTERDQEM